MVALTSVMTPWTPRPFGTTVFTPYPCVPIRTHTPPLRTLSPILTITDVAVSSDLTVCDVGGYDSDRSSVATGSEISRVAATFADAHTFSMYTALVAES